MLKVVIKNLFPAKREAFPYACVVCSFAFVKEGQLDFSKFFGFVTLEKELLCRLRYYSPALR
jgi:hypothetical protein